MLRSSSAPPSRSAASASLKPPDDPKSAELSAICGKRLARSTFGEDLAWGPASASWVVGAWLASPEHRAILLRPGFRRVGIGAFQGTFSGRAGALVVTADFAGR